MRTVSRRCSASCPSPCSFACARWLPPPSLVPVVSKWPALRLSTPLSLSLARSRSLGLSLRNSLTVRFWRVRLLSKRRCTRASVRVLSQACPAACPPSQPRQPASRSSSSRTSSSSRSRPPTAAAVAAAAVEPAHQNNQYHHHHHQQQRNRIPSRTCKYTSPPSLFRGAFRLSDSARIIPSVHPRVSVSASPPHTHRLPPSPPRRSTRPRTAAAAATSQDPPEAILRSVSEPI